MTTDTDQLQEVVKPDITRIEDFDRNYYRLNFTNGTLDLPCDPPLLRKHRREDRIRRLIDIDYDPHARCPEFLRFLLVTMGGNPDSDEDTEGQRIAREMAGYLKRMFGSSTTGDISEKGTLVCNVNTDTGKTTLLQIIRSTFPEYSVTIPIETLMSYTPFTEAIDAYLRKTTVNHT